MVKLSKTDFLLNQIGDMALKRRAKELLNQLDVKAMDKILDAGCGDGFYLYLLSSINQNIKLYGIDADQKALQSAKNNLKNKKIILKKTDLLNKLPFRDNYFNKIILSEVLEHLENESIALKEINRVLAPEGLLIVTVPNTEYPFLWDPINWVLEHLFKTHVKSGFWAGIWNQHIRLYKEAEIKKILEKNGFKVTKIKSLTWWCIPFNHYLLNLAARLVYNNLIDKEKIKQISKFSKTEKNILIKIIFKMVNFIDQLNDIFPRGGGVCVFIKSLK